MTGKGRLHLIPAASGPPSVHRLHRFAFRAPIGADAQRVMINLHLDLHRQMLGLVSCAAGFDRSTGQWLVHCEWEADRAPLGIDIDPSTVATTMMRLRPAGGLV